ncbi:MAG: YlzJ-like family protein [Acetanaerobacterium sp.]
MLLYTTEPYEMIFQGGAPDMQGTAPPVARMINGVLVEGSEQPDGIHITRLLSTDPRHYLNPEFAPGSVIKQTM